MVYNAISDISGNVSQFTDYADIVLNHVGVLSAYQKKLTIPYDAAMQTNLNDIRFNIWNGAAWEYVPHWIESKTDSTTADVWIKNDYINGDTVVRMYYGNDGLSSGSSGADTFPLLFDDFTGASIDTGLWNIQGVSTAVSNSIFSAKPTSDAWSGIYSVDTFPQDVIIRTKMKTAHFGVLTYYEMFQTETALNNDHGSALIANHASAEYSGKYFNYNGAFTNVAITGYTANTWHVVELIRKSDRASWSIDDANFVDNTGNYQTGNALIHPKAYASGAELYIDWIFVAKYTATEPTYTIGTPQHQRRHPQFI